MDFNEKYFLITRNIQEIIGEEDLKKKLKSGKEVSVYCGYEPSGDIHLGHLVSMTKLLDFQKAGLKIKVLLADWHAYLNQKGDWDFLDKQVKDWKKNFEKFGLKKVEFVRGSKMQRNLEYIDDVFRLAVKNTLNRGLRSMQEVARNIENAKISQVIYPLMQIADFKFLKIDGALGGIEQRKIHMLALESLKDLNYKKPFLIHHELIPSLKGPGTGKMSSSGDKLDMIAISDSSKEIQSKINKSYCPEGVVKDNAVLGIFKLIIFPRYKEVVFQRPEKFGGDVVFENYEEFEKIYSKKQIHPLDLKNTCFKYLKEILKK